MAQVNKIHKKLSSAEKSRDNFSHGNSANYFFQISPFKIRAPSDPLFSPLQMYKTPLKTENIELTFSGVQNLMQQKDQLQLISTKKKNQKETQNFIEISEFQPTPMKTRRVLRFDDRIQKNKNVKNHKRSNKGLRKLSIKVCKLIQKLKSASYSQVAQNLLEQISDDSHQECMKQLNIKRRVYDALNVLAAAGVITKEGKKVYCSRKNKLRKQLIKEFQEKEKYKSQILRKFEQLSNKLTALQKLNKRNKQQKGHILKILLPLVLLQNENKNNLMFSKSQNKLLLKSKQELKITADLDILKLLSKYSKIQQQ